jgi:hypothetical protein
MQHTAHDVAPLDRAVSCHASYSWNWALLINALVGRTYGTERSSASVE